MVARSRAARSSRPGLVSSSSNWRRWSIMRIQTGAVFLTSPAILTLPREAAVAEAGARQPGAVEHVTPIQQNLRAHGFRHLLPIQLAILRPFGYQHQRVGAFG